MITEKDINDMYLHLRKTNQDIPDEALEFMKIACMDKLAIWKIKDKVSLDIKGNEFGLTLDVRENFDDKVNRMSQLHFSPFDLQDFQQVGNKLIYFGRYIAGQYF